jgi:hypothetical protein
LLVEIKDLPSPPQPQAVAESLEGLGWGIHTSPGKSFNEPEVAQLIEKYPKGCIEFSKGTEFGKGVEIGRTDIIEASVYAIRALTQAVPPGTKEE